MSRPVFRLRRPFGGATLRFDVGRPGVCTAALWLSDLTPRLVRAPVRVLTSFAAEAVATPACATAPLPDA